MTIGETLKRLRKSRGLTQAEVASKLSLSRTSYTKYENDVHIPNAEQIQTLSNIFTVSPTEILTPNSTIYSTNNSNESATLNNDDNVLKDVYNNINCQSKTQLISKINYKFKEARQACGLTQKEIANALNVTAATYSRYENGLIQPDPETLKRIAALMNTTVDFLLGVQLQKDFSVDHNIIEKSALRSDEKKLLGVYNTLDDQTKTQLMTIAYLLMANLLAKENIDIIKFVEEELHKSHDR